MKKINFYIVLIMVVCICTTSCKKFLDESSQDEIRPTTANDLAALMYSDAYPYLTTVDTYTDLLTDDVQCNGPTQLTAGGNDPTMLPYLINGSYIFTWQSNMFDNTSGVIGSSTSDLPGVNSWQIYYGRIKGCNVVLDNVNLVSGTDQAKNAIMGQALFLRAFYYLKLVTLYGQPYNGVGIDPSKNLGVPLILSSQVSDVYPIRNTLQQVYSQIESDLLKAADLLKNNYTAPSLFRVSHVAAYALLSRLYLYMGRDQDMANVITYATNALAINPRLTQLTTYIQSGSTFSINSAGIYDQTLSQEVIWSYGPNPSSASTFIPGPSTAFPGLPPYTASVSLAAMYDKGNGTTNRGDLRYYSYILKRLVSGVNYDWTSGKIGTTQNYGSKGIRVAELYLNRAEALIRRYKSTANGADLTQALSDLNTLRQSRYDTRSTTYVPVTLTDPDLLFKFCQDERRRELCLEDSHRWVDIKRWGLAISHTYIDQTGTSTTYNLPAGSLIYALPIPYDVVARNYNLQQNPR